jgi:hypothetical protein
MLNIGAVIDRSAGLRALAAGGVPLNPSYPLLNPDDIAQELWTLVVKRDRVEAIIARNAYRERS